MTDCGEPPRSRVDDHGRPLPVIHGAGANRLSMDGARIVITGAGGWLGLATLEMLYGLLGRSFYRRVVCFGATGRTLALRGGVEVAQRPLAALGELPAAPSLLLHFAFQTAGAMTIPESEFREINRAIGERTLGALDRIGAEAVFVASSGAAYTAGSAETSPFKRLYGSLKLEEEARFRTWATETGNAAVIARLFNLSGPYINNRSHYALACFIADALAERPITIRASNRVYRSFVAIEQVMSVVFGALTKPDRGILSFDAAGETVYEVGAIAQSVAATLDHRLGIRRPPLKAGAPEDRYVGDGAAHRTLSQKYGIPSIDLADQIRQTACFMAECPEDS